MPLAGNQSEAPCELRLRSRATQRLEERAGEASMGEEGVVARRSLRVVGSVCRTSLPCQSCLLLISGDRRSRAGVVRRWRNPFLACYPIGASCVQGEEAVVRSER